MWDAARQRLLFVDIEAGSIHAVTDAGRVECLHRSAARVGALALSDGDGLIFTEGAGVARLALGTGQVCARAAPVASDARYRFNDGACDPQGRFVTGLMDQGPVRMPGTLYRFDADLAATPLHVGIGLPNGLAWSHDGQTVFFVDSLARSIFQAPYASDGPLGPVTPFVQTPESLGRPDGIALDAEHGMWVCQFGGGCLLYYDRAGQLRRQVAMPVPHPTSCCFGGPDLDTLYITTASFTLSDAQRQAYPDAGAVYAIRPPVRGVERHGFRARLPGRDGAR